MEQLMRSYYSLCSELDAMSDMASSYDWDKDHWSYHDYQHCKQELIQLIYRIRDRLILDKGEDAEMIAWIKNKQMLQNKEEITRLEQDPEYQRRGAEVFASAIDTKQEQQQEIEDQPDN
jgi:hypothetical protein